MALSPSKTRTGDVGRDVWIRTRHAALVEELVRRGVSRGRAWFIALAPVAHWGDETGWGRSEWNYNIGNIRWVSQTLNWIMLQGSDDPAPARYCSYETLEQGVSATLDLLLKPRYLPAWQHLVTTLDAAGWYERLLRPPVTPPVAGWHPWSQESVDNFASEYARVQRTVGAPPADQDLAESGVPLSKVIAAGGLTIAIIELWRRYGGRIWRR